jgi:hypothetical protein
MKKENVVEITSEDVADLIEYSVNKTKPRLKTQRGIGNEFSIQFGRRKFVVAVRRQEKTKPIDSSG